MRETPERSCKCDHFLLAVSAIALSGATLGQAAAGPAAGLQGAAERLRITEPVAQVCREVCRENVCRTRCVNERDRDEVVHERVYRDEHRDRRPGVELNVPGVNIEAH